MSTQLEPAIRLGPDSAGMIMTPEEFDQAEFDEEYRYELVHGVVAVTPIPSEAEADPNQLLGHLFLTYQETHPRGSALDETLPERYVRTSTSRRRADRVVWAGLGRRPNPTEDVPAIVVEFVSRSKADRRRDYEEKRREYREAGVAEYWIVDRFHRQMTVFANRPDKPAQQIVREGDTYRTDLLPGFELPLDRLLRAADKWAP